MIHLPFKIKFKIQYHSILTYRGDVQRRPGNPMSLWHMCKLNFG